jgi:hypothetical protein
MFLFCSLRVKPHFRAERSSRSGNDVRRNLIFDKGDTVAQLQLALLEPLQPQQIRRRRLMQRINRSVEIPVFLLQPCELGFEFALIFVGHGLFNQNADEIAKIPASRTATILPGKPLRKRVPMRLTGRFSEA